MREHLKRLGPGLITGAANDDPAAIGTHAQVGGEFGSATFWLSPFTIPLTAVVLEMCAQVGNVSGRGLVTILRFHYPRWALWLAVSLFAIANIVNLAADLRVMAESIRLLAGGPVLLWLLLVAIASAALQIFVPYAPYAKVLKVFALSLLAYVVAVVLLPQDWGQVFRSTFVPQLGGRGFAMAAVAVIGTRLSPYVIVWQPAQVVEEDIGRGQHRLAERAGATEREVRAMQVDVVAGTIVANIVTWAVLVATAATLHARGVTNVQSVGEVAEALKPAAGSFAYALFAIGTLATGMLAVPVLAGGVAYAIGEALGWERGLAKPAPAARRFYAVIGASIAIAVVIGATGGNPIRQLVLSQILNAIAAVPLVLLLLLICNNRRIMGERINGLLANVLGWGTLAIVAIGAALAIALAVR